MKQYNPKDYNVIFGLPPVVSSDEVIAIDTEFAGQEKARLHRPHGTFALLQCVLASDPRTVYLITETKDIQPCLDNLDAGTWVLQNFLYDVRQLRPYAKIMPRKKLWDIMVMEQIMYSGYYADFGLNHLVRRYCDIYLDKSVRDTFSESDGELTIEQAQYGALDVIATLDVYLAQLKVVDNDDMNIWRTIELPYIWALLTTKGLGFDDECWMGIADRHQIIVDMYIKKYPDVNLNSPGQVKTKLKSLGIKVSSTNEKTLAPLDNEFAKDVLDYRKHAKRTSTYGASFVEKYQEEDGRIWTSIRPIGAVTSRSSSGTPNMQNIPNDAETRNCFVASDDEHELVIADWSSQEPRFAAYLSDDKLLLNIFREERDVYVATALHAFGEEIDKSTPEGKARRNEMKPLVLGAFYGKTPYGLSKDLDISKDVAEEMFEALYSAYSGFAKWANKQQNTRKKEYVTSALGRKAWTTPYASNWEQIRVNYPIQMSASDAMKIAFYKIIIAWNKHQGKGAIIGDWYSPIRIPVHDELVCEIPKPDTDEFKKVLADVMIEVAESIHKGIPAAVETYTGRSWSAK